MKSKLKINNSPTSSHDRQDMLMKKYMINQKSVKVSFGDMFDSQSRYKVAAKKRVFPMSNTEGEGYTSNFSFHDNGANQNRSSAS